MGQGEFHSVPSHWLSTHLPAGGATEGWERVEFRRQMFRECQARGSKLKGLGGVGYLSLRFSAPPEEAFQLS